ncbi:MAG TPA: EAL domain-containing protein [Dongiaceae bacterium]|jgi:EAL domain-containing protein (putative c-di-GMP-specific phosphodiesterase class I)|nr:EAL domain-containing protein [Dongiaceae bacterium]
MGDTRGDLVRRERDRFLGFSFASADLLLELTGDLRIAWAGGAVRALLGVDADKLSAVAIAEFLSPLDAVLLGTALRQLQPGERRRGIDLTVLHAAEPGKRATACVYRSLDASKADFFLSISVPPADTAAAATKHPRDRATGLIEAVDFAESTANALRTARAAGQSARLTLVQICGEGELDQLLGRDRSKALLAEIGTQLRKHAVTEGGAARLGDGRFSVAELDGAPAQAITDAITRIGENYDLDPAALKVQETAVSFRGHSLGEDDVESILSHVLDRFRTQGAQAISAGSAESYLRKITAETLSRVVMMRDLIHERRLNLHYQPIVDLVERKPHHYEVLLRFADGRSPFEDIQFAEQINTIHEVDLAVTQGAVARLQQAMEQKQDLSLAVNMSARSLLNDAFLSMFEEVANKVGELRDRLIIEITESAKLEDLGKAARAVDRLTARGHPICLDDFGAGASSLPYLQQLIVGYVKIDGAYVKGISERARERAIIEGVLATCKSLGVQTVAEMVEREEQHKILQELGVTLGQGWLYGRPSPDIPPSERVAVRVPRKLNPAAISRLLVKRN